eukprot:11209885-Alexandrium_andersonii.AAC.1
MGRCCPLQQTLRARWECGWRSSSWVPATRTTSPWRPQVDVRTSSQGASRSRRGRPAWWSSATPCLRSR